MFLTEYSVPITNDVSDVQPCRATTRQDKTALTQAHTLHDTLPISQAHLGKLNAKYVKLKATGLRKQLEKRGLSTKGKK
eukprot:SAG22_NODE_8050_length_687_cov_1.217687_1_plen_78_part_10